MKKVTLLLIFLTGFLIAFAQQKPYHTQYILNNYLLNPAVTGIENYADIKLSYRNQWTDFEGSPVTAYASFHTALNKPDDKTTATSFEKKGYNFSGKQAAETYTVSPAHWGVGAMLMSDKAGYLNRWGAYASVAYHKPLGVSTSLALGFRAGVSGIGLDRSQIKWGDLNPDDPAIGYNNGDLKKLKPELGAGLWLYGSRYFAGVSVLNIIPGKQAYSKEDQYGFYNQPNYFLSAGYKLFAGDDVSILPSATIQIISPQPAQLHLNVKVQYRDVVWAGASYRATDQLGGFAAMAGVNISNTLNLSYAYDMATSSRLRSYAGNTHELMIGFIIGNRYGDGCPRNIW